MRSRGCVHLLRQRRYQGLVSGDFRRLLFIFLGGALQKAPFCGRWERCVLGTVARCFLTYMDDQVVIHTRVASAGAPQLTCAVSPVVLVLACPASRHQNTFALADAKAVA